MLIVFPCDYHSYHTSRDKINSPSFPLGIEDEKIVADRENAAAIRGDRDAVARLCLLQGNECLTRVGRYGQPEQQQI